MGRSGRSLGILALVVSNLLWAGTYPTTAIALRSTSPIFLTLFRLGFSALIMAPFVRLPKGQHWERRALFLAGALGVIGFSLPVLLQTWGLQLSTPALAAISISLEPLLTGAMAAVFLKEPMPAPRRIALGMAFIGAWAIAGFPRPGHGGYLTGDLLLIAAIICFAFTNAFSARLTALVPPATATGSTLVFGFLSLIPVWLLTGASFPETLPPIGSVVAGLYLAILATAGAYLLWMFSLKRVQVGTAALFLYLQPVFGVLFSVLLVGTHPTPDFYLGAIVIALALHVGREKGPAKPG